jgi:hypothetical protein
MWPVASPLADGTSIQTMMIRIVRKARKGPRVPIKEWLRDPSDEAALSRMWQAIEARFPRRGSRSSPMLMLMPDD